MKYRLYDDKERHVGTFNSVEKLRNFLCDRKYNTNCDFDLSCTFDYIKSIKWYFDCLLYTSPSPRDSIASRMPSSA